LAERLRQLGFDVVVRPLLEIEPIETGPVDLDAYDWLVLTSATAARELRRRARGRAGKVAAIGRATAEAWGDVDLVAQVSTQEGLLAELPCPAGRVLFAGAEGARQLLAAELGADVIVLYRTRPVRSIESVDGDLAVVASPSAARALAVVSRSMPVVSIGPETTAAATAAGLRVAAEAVTQDVDGLVSAIRAAG
jgi:uroporphyrinogen-III synthase